MSTEKDETLETELVTVSDIGARAGVRPSAVSNWRRRHHDFPAPVERSSGSDLFRFDDVIRWLESHGRNVVFQDALPGVGRVGRVGSVDDINLALALIALRSVAEKGFNREVDRVRSDIEVGQEVSALATEIQAQRRDPTDVFVSVIDADSSETGRLIRELAVLHSTDKAALPEAFEALLSSRDRTRLDPTVSARTAPSLAELVVRLTAVGANNVVFDPAAGEAGFLIAAAHLAAAHDPARHVALAGQEKDAATWRIATQRLLVHGLDADLRLGDSLATDNFPTLQVDAVVCDPPFGLHVPPDTWSPTDSRWQFGMPPKVADLAWVQLAAHYLRPDGSACVVLPAGSLFRQGLEGRIRVELLRSRSIEAIILLPANTATSSTVPVALWVLRSPDSTAPDHVLLIDAAQPSNGTRRRSYEAGVRGGIDSELSDRILGCIDAWRNDPLSFEAAPEFAAPVEIEALLAAGGDLVPTRWTRSPGVLDPSRTIGDLRSRSDDIDGLSSRLAALPGLDLPLTAQQGSPRRARIRELISQDAIELIVGVRIDREDSDPEGVRIAGVWDFRNEAARFLDRSAIPPEAPTTLPGDVLVAPGPRGLRVRVDEAGGSIIAAPLQVLRVKAPSLDPRVIAAFIGSRENLRIATGSLARVNLREVEIPLLDPRATSFLKETLGLLDEKGRLARKTWTRVEQLRESLISAFARGDVEPEGAAATSISARPKRKPSSASA